MRIWRWLFGFGCTCAGLWLLGQASPLWAAASTWFDEALTVSGARIYLRLGELMLAFDRGLMTFLGGKWRDLCAMSARLLPPGASEAAGAAADVIGGALGALWE